MQRLGAGQPGATLDGCMPWSGPPVSAREHRVYEERRQRRLVREAGRFDRVHLLRRQAGRCAVCKTVFDLDLEQFGDTSILVRRDPATGRHDPASRPPLVPPRAADAVDLDNAGGGLSRMRGDPQRTVLRGPGEQQCPPGYPTLRSNILHAPRAIPSRVTTSDEPVC